MVLKGLSVDLSVFGFSLINALLVRTSGNLGIDDYLALWSLEMLVGQYTLSQELKAAR